METFSQCSDLLEVLSEVHKTVTDSRRIWCFPASGFETTVTSRLGLILGGAWSPRFLRNQGGWKDVPWMACLNKPRIIFVARAATPLKTWIPLLEAIMHANESLLLVTGEIDTELLDTLAINSIKGNLTNCPVKWENASDARLPDLTKVIGIPLASVPDKTGQLPLADEACVRQAATVVFSSAGDLWASAAVEVAVIHVGGEDYDDQQARLRFLATAIRHADLGLLDGFRQGYMQSSVESGENSH